MSKTIKIPGRLESAETGNVVAYADAILDESKGKKQNVINQEVDAELLLLDQEKQGNLTFDQTPTENSTNPVTSGGVYAADQLLSQAIEAILLLIPSAASALNKLVDLATMNSSISTATASFKGTYNIVSDLHLTVSATHAQIAAALDALSLGADNNDYSYVQVPNTDTAPTEIAKTERYKFNGTNWAYEYDLNNSGFTSVQWAAINSNITAILVSKLSALPTNEALMALLAAKQDNLTFDDAPTSGSNNPVTSGGINTRNNEIIAMITALDAAKQDVLMFDTTPTENSTNPVTSNGVYQAIYLVQAALAALDGRMLSAEHSIELLTEDVGVLRTLYQALSQSDIIVGAKPATGVTNTVYRVPGTSTYADWMYYNGAWVKLAEYSTLDGYLYKGIATPSSSPASSAVKMIYFALTAGTYTNYGNLVVTEGISILKYDGANWTQDKISYMDGGVFDVTAYSGREFASLSALLSDANLNNLIPTAVRKGGMSIKFVESSDHKYVQYRLMAQTFTTDVTQWQGVDDEPTFNSKNLTESGGVYNAINKAMFNNGQYVFTHNHVGTGAKKVGYNIIAGHKISILNTGSVTGAYRLCYDDGTFNPVNLTNLPAGATTVVTAAKNGSYIELGSGVGNTTFEVEDISSPYAEFKTLLRSKNILANTSVDFNSIQPNTITSLQDMTSVSNAPYVDAKNGMVLTLRAFTETNGVGAIGAQIFIAADGSSYVRRHYGNYGYGTWNKFLYENDIQVVKEFIGEELDLDYTNDSYVGINGLGQLSLHTESPGLKLSEAFTLHQGERIVLSAQGYKKAVSLLTRFENDTPVECVICSQGTGAYATYTYDVLKTGTYRISGAVSPAPVAYLRKDLTVIPKEPINAFVKVGVIGDSLASGASGKNGVVSDHYDTSWPQYLARKTGNTYYNFTRGGMTAYEWMSESQHGYPAASQPDKKCSGYIIALGVNDAARVKKYEEGTPSADHLYPLGSISDINDSDYTQNADSFYGWYGRVIQSVMGLVDGCKIFAILIPNEDDAVYYNQINTAISEICEHFGIAVVNISNFAQFDTFQSLIYKNKSKIDGHYNAITYQYISNIIYQAINSYMCNNWDDYMDIQDIVIN